MSGTPLDWDRLVRLVYLDEAGVANREQEPYLAVCGVILNADQDYRHIVRHLQSLIRKHVDPAQRPGFVFHANRIWHGNNEFDRRRERWTKRESRLDVLQSLADIIPKFHLSVVCGFVHRLSFDEAVKRHTPHINADKLDRWAHAEAFMLTAEDVEHWMRRNAPREVAMLVAEDANKKKAAIKMMHAGSQLAEDEDHLLPFEVFTTEFIVDTVHFAAKADSPMLQLADVCSFIIKRKLMKADIGDLYDRIAPRIASPWAVSDFKGMLTSRPLRGRLVVVPREHVGPS